MDERRIECADGTINLHDAAAGIEIETETEDATISLTMSRATAAQLIATLAAMLADPNVGQ